MASGFFLGGMQEGMAEADKRAIQREQMAQELGLKTRALDLTESGQKANIGIAERAQTLAEKNAARAAGREGAATVDKHIAETMAVVGETIKTAVAAGRDPATIQKAVAPLVESAKRLAPRAGRDPAMFDAQVNAMLTSPSLVEAGTVKGAAAGAEKVATAKVLSAAGFEDEASGFKTKDEKVKAENTLRDDFVKQSQPFITMRDAKNRLDNLEKTGAGDMTLVFQFMKMLDPTSTVREGEYATASNSGGVPSAVQGLYNKAIGEGSIGDKARKEILGQANKIFDAAAVQHDKTATTFAAIAKRYKLDPNNVAIDLAPTGKSISGVTPSGLKFTVGK
jgi:hypothetical protein